MNTRRWQDWVMIVFGAWLFFSPFWMQAYGSASGIAAWNSYILGVLVALFGVIALATPRRWEEWVELVLGIWLVISPFVLAFFNNVPGAAWNTVVLGVLVAVDALWALAASAPARGAGVTRGG